MTERARNIAVGVTAIGAMVGLAALLLLFGQLMAWFEPAYRVQLLLPQAQGISEGAPVTLNGIRIGEVHSVALRDPPTEGIAATLRIREPHRIPDTATVTVSAPLLGGSAAVALAAPHAQPPIDYLPTDGQAVIRGDAAGAGLLGGVTDQLMARLDAPLQQFETLATDVQALSQTWREVGENLKALTDARSSDAVDQGDAQANLATLIQRTDARLAEMRQVIAGIEQYVNDPELRENVLATTRNARQLTEKASQVAETAGATIQDAQQRFAALQERYMGLADNLSATVTDARTMLASVGEGQGTAGKLLNDPALYNNLNDAAVRLQRAIDEMQILMQKIREEGIEVGI